MRRDSLTRPTCKHLLPKHLPTPVTEAIGEKGEKGQPDPSHLTVRILLLLTWRVTTNVTKNKDYWFLAFA